MTENEKLNIPMTVKLLFVAYNSTAMFGPLVAWGATYYGFAKTFGVNSPFFGTPTNETMHQVAAQVGGLILTTAMMMTLALKRPGTFSRFADRIFLPLLYKFKEEIIRKNPQVIWENKNSRPHISGPTNPP